MQGTRLISGSNLLFRNNFSRRVVRRKRREVSQLQGKPKLKLMINFIFIIAIIGIIYYVLQNSIADIINQLGQTEPLILGIVVALGLGFLVVEGRNIARIAGNFKKDFSTKDGFFGYCYSAFCRVISFGTATTVSEVMYYRRKKIPTSQAIGVTTVHMILYKIGVVLMSAIGLVTQSYLIYQKSPMMIPFVLYGIIVTLLIISGLLFLSINRKFHGWLIKKAHKWIKKEAWREKIDVFNEQIDALGETVRTIVSNREVLVSLIFLNIGKLFFWYSIPFFILSSTHNLSYLTSFSMTAMAVALAGVIPTPAGLGSFEFVYMLLFRPLVGTVDAASSLLLYRFATYVLPFLIGMIYSAGTKRKEINEELHEIKVEKEEHAQ